MSAGPAQGVASQTTWLLHPSRQSVEFHLCLAIGAQTELNIELRTLKAASPVGPAEKRRLTEIQEELRYYRRPSSWSLWPW